MFWSLFGLLLQASSVESKSQEHVSGAADKGVTGADTSLRRAWYSFYGLTMVTLGNAVVTLFLLRRGGNAVTNDDRGAVELEPIEFITVVARRMFQPTYSVCTGIRKPVATSTENGSVFPRPFLLNQPRCVVLLPPHISTYSQHTNSPHNYSLDGNHHCDHWWHLCLRSGQCGGHDGIDDRYKFKPFHPLATAGSQPVSQS